MPNVMLIQTAFIGDVVLATGLIEKLHEYYPDALLDFLVRKGNEKLLIGHPFLHKVLVWDKQKGQAFQPLGYAQSDQEKQVRQSDQHAAVYQPPEY